MYKYTTDESIVIQDQTVYKLHITHIVEFVTAEHLEEMSQMTQSSLIIWLNQCWTDGHEMAHIKEM